MVMGLVFIASEPGGRPRKNDITSPGRVEAMAHATCLAKTRTSIIPLPSSLCSFPAMALLTCLYISHRN